MAVRREWIAGGGGTATRPSLLRHGETSTVRGGAFERMTAFSLKPELVG
jgi:hypothetical protein